METSSNTTSARHQPISLLVDPVFRRIWLIGALIGTMRWLDMLVVGIWVFDVTRSAFTVAVVTLLRLVPMLAGVFAGALAERLALQRFLTVALALMTLGYLLLAGLAATGAIEVWHVAIGSVLAGLYWATEMSVRRTLAGEVAGAPRMAAAMALDWATFSITRTIGPLVGGGLYVAIGLAGSYLLGALLFGIGAGLAATLSVGRAARAGRQGRVATIILEGFRTARLLPVVMGTLAVSIVLNFFGFPYTSMVPVIGKDVLLASPIAVGLLSSAEGIGALFGSLLLAWLGRSVWLGRCLLAGSAMVLIGAFGFGASANYLLSLAALILLGCGTGIFATTQSTLILTHAPADQQSRMMGVLTTCIGLGQLGHLHIGLLAGWLGAPGAVLLSTAEGLLLLGLCLWRWPVLWRGGA
ncbi:MFS transporter [Desertibaculum subflavum]|uniref:MFS transporter n=1 Tax=Desertibaculum subflavum TaxID=2268458 RepID=UPI0013C4F467